MNLNNLVMIEGYLYKITSDKTIIITDGDINKITTADQLEESDTSNHIEIRHAWANYCNCNVTNKSWKEVKTTSTNGTGNPHRTISELTFTNFTTVKYLPPYNATITPHWTIISYIHTQRKADFGGIWNCEREQIQFFRQIRLKHTFTTIPTNDPYYVGDKYWQQITGWTLDEDKPECKFNFKSDHKYTKYTTSRGPNPLDGYCFAIHTFAQTGNVTNPTLINSFSYNLYYALFPLKWRFLQQPCTFAWDAVLYP